MSYDDQLFTKVCTLEAQLELAHKRMYEAEQKLIEIEKLLRQALQVLSTVVDDNR